MTLEYKEPEEKGWLAGILDGEGSVSMDKMPSGWRRPAISVCSTDKEIVLECRRIAGFGSICERPSKRKKEKMVWVWRVHSRKAVELLKSLHDCLKCPKKSKRAKLIVAHYLVNRNGYYTEEEKMYKKRFEKVFFLL